MIIFKILQNPLVKAIGIGAVLYFGLFFESNNPNSLSQRLSADNIKKSVDIVKHKTKYIAHNIELAQKSSLQQQNDVDITYQVAAEDEKDKILVKDDEGLGKKSVQCGQKVQLTYFILNKMAQELKRELIKKVVVGSKQNIFLEQSIINVKEGELKEIILLPDSKIEDEEIAKIVKKENSKVKMYLMVTSIDPEINKQITCK